MRLFWASQAGPVGTTLCEPNRYRTKLHRFAARSCAVSGPGALEAHGFGAVRGAHAHPEDIGGCRCPECQPQHAARMGASLRISEAAAVAGQAPALHAR